MVNEDVSFGFNISDDSTAVRHSFVRRVSFRSTVKTLNNFPHVWTVIIGYRVLEKIFLTFFLRLVDRLGSFTTSIYPLLVVLMDRLTKAISIADFCSNMWSNPRFRSFAWFRFSKVSSCGRDGDVTEASNSKR